MANVVALSIISHEAVVALHAFIEAIKSYIIKCLCEDVFEYFGIRCLGGGHQRVIYLEFVDDCSQSNPDRFFKISQVRYENRNLILPDPENWFRLDICCLYFLQSSSATHYQNGLYSYKPPSHLRGFQLH